MHTTRRAALALGLGGLAALSASPSPASARAPLAGRQVPGVQRRRVGAFEVTALLDGHLDLDPALFPKAGPDAAKLLDAAFRPAGPIRTPVNAYAINTGERLILVDAGTGRGYAPTLGGLPDALAAAGIDPAQVDTVLATHLHVDHVGGLVRDGRAVFPDAELLIPQAEAEFWLDPAALSRAPAAMQPFFRLAQDACAPYAARTRRFGPGEARIAPGIEAVAEPGHTPGHTGYVVSDGGERLWLWGDVVHAAALQFPRPELGISFDVDGDAAAATRRRAFDRAASERTLVAGAHLPFPGFGHVERDGAGRYAFVPAPFLPL